MSIPHSARFAAFHEVVAHLIIAIERDDGLMAVVVGLQEDAEGSGLAADPADRFGQGLVDRAAFADSGVAQDHQQVEVSLGEGVDIALEFRIGRHADGVRWQSSGSGHNNVPERRGGQPGTLSGMEVEIARVFSEDFGSRWNCLDVRDAAR